MIGSISTPVFADEKINVTAADFESGRVIIRLKDQLDWEAIARANFKTFDIDKPDIELLNKNYTEIGGISDFHYTADLPASLPHRHYYLLTPLDIEELHPDKIRGLIRYVPVHSTSRKRPNWGYNRYRVDLFYGYVTSPIPSTIKRMPGGFVLQSSHKLELVYRDVPTKRVEGKDWVYSDKTGELVYVDSNGNRAVRQQDRYSYPLDKLSTAKSFEVDGNTYLFTVWSNKPFEGAGCMGGLVVDKLNRKENKLTQVYSVGTDCIGD